VGGSWYRAGWGAAESACSGGLSECVGGCGRVGGRGELVGRVGVEGRWSLLLLLMIVRASAGRVGSEGGLELVAGVERTEKQSFLL